MAQINTAKIRELRESHKLTTAEVAEQLGVSAPLITHYEVGRRTPSLDTIVLLAKLYGTTVDELLKDVEE